MRVARLLRLRHSPFLHTSHQISAHRFAFLTLFNLAAYLGIVH